MIETLWKFRIYIFIRAVDVTLANKQAFAQIYVNNGGMETLENEMKCFDSVKKFSLSGELPAQVYGLSTPAKLEMRDAFKAMLDQLTDARYAVVANTTLAEYAENELILTNFPVTPNGQIVTWETACTYLYNEYGLIEIPDLEEPL